MTHSATKGTIFGRENVAGSPKRKACRFCPSAFFLPRMRVSLILLSVEHAKLLPIEMSRRHALEKGKMGKRFWHRLWLLKRRKKNLRCLRRRRRRQFHGYYGPSRLPVNEHTKKSVSLGTDRKLTIELPERLDFDDNYEATVSYFAILRQAVKKRVRIRSLRFHKLKFISPSAALVLASEVDLWNQNNGGRLRASVDTWDENIKRLLCQMGYFKLLGIPQPEMCLPPGKMTFLPFKRGVVGAMNGGSIAKELRIEIEQLVGRRIKKHFLFEGLSEAITNVGQHAYPENSDFLVKQWWVSASYDHQTQELCVTFFDQGKGIPKTLPSSDIYEVFRDLFAMWSDSQKIAAAMETGRTSSPLSERGKGLQNLVEFAKSHNGGKLSIYSLSGLYCQTFSSQHDNHVSSAISRDYQGSIGGTLIEWSIIL